jgi:hypothetical protein
MPRDNKGPTRYGIGGNDTVRDDLDHTIRDRDTWGEPLSYVDLLTHPTVQSRIARMIVQSALKRPRRTRRASGASSRL